MHYYEVLIADGAYHSDAPLTYSYDQELPKLSTVSVPLRAKLATGFVLDKVKKPSFSAKPIKSVVALQPLPDHCLALARWLSQYYGCTLAESLRLFGPSSTSIRQIELPAKQFSFPQSQLNLPLTTEQKSAVSKIKTSSSTTLLLHGETGSGKTRVYLDLAKETLRKGRSVIMLTPEISLTSQLSAAAGAFLNQEVLVLHSQLGQSARKKLWLRILTADKPVVIVGARSALFAPVKDVGLIVVDEAHEPAYKQGQAPRYHTNRVASRLGVLSGAKVILGGATPSIDDYWLAEQKQAVVRMIKPAIAGSQPAQIEIVDVKDRSNFGSSPHLSLKLIEEIKSALAGKKQAIIYLNRRGSARLILCSNCGWQMVCPRCDIPLVYHGDAHEVRCHTCGFKAAPPSKCPVCSAQDIIYRSIGTKALAEEVSRLFPQANVRRFDSDNVSGERLDQVYHDVLSGKVDILVGTQLLAKGLDLPRLGLVGVISADSSLSLPDFSAEERAFQLLYQIIGRVGRGHVSGKVIIQTMQPDSLLIKSAAARNYQDFYTHSLIERQKFKFPPFAYLAQLVSKRRTAGSAEQSAEKLKLHLAKLKLPIEIIGPVAPFYAKRGDSHYSQLILKAKNRRLIEAATKDLPAGWQLNIDPTDLL